MDRPPLPISDGNLGPDEQACTEILQLAYRAALRAQASPADAEDAAQNVAARFSLGWNEEPILGARLRSPDYWRGYVAKAARNAYLDLLRSNKRRTARERSASGSKHLAPLIQRPNVVGPAETESADLVQFHAQLGVVDLANQHLVGRRHQVIELTFLHGLSVPEIAEKLGLSDRTVRDHKQHGLDTLRQAMRDQGAAID